MKYDKDKKREQTAGGERKEEWKLLISDVIAVFYVT